MESTINDRILKLIEILSRNQSDFAKSIGISTQSVSGIVNPYKTRRSKPGSEILQAILKNFPNVSADWLMMGESEIFRNANRIVSKVQISSDSSSLMSKTLKENYEKTIEDLRYLVDIQREMLNNQRFLIESLQTENSIVNVHIS